MTGLMDTIDGASKVAHLGVTELDADGRFVSFNLSYLTMLGLKQADLLGQHWSTTVHPDDHGRAQDAFHGARENGRGYVEVRGRRGDSSIVYQALNVSGVRDNQGEFTGYYCILHDISGYTRQQEALMLAVESAPSGLLILDSERKIQSANRAVEKLFGYTRQELAGRPLEALLTEEFRHLANAEAVSSGESAEAVGGRDLWGLRKDGVEIPLQVFLSPIETDTGKLILCTIIDIAERVRYERQLMVAKQAAESANRAKSDFLARMSHEIRTPMNLIMGMNALLLESSLDAKQRQHIEISDRNVRRLLRLINGILDLSKVEAGNLTLVEAPFDLSHVLKDCAATMAAATEQKGLQFEISIDPDVPRYWTGDAERLQQVLLNLIGNSVKFTSQGKVNVVVRSQPGKPGQPGLRFEVTDTGCGVPADKGAMIFEPFQQAEGFMDRPYEGTGLGLAIARTLVELMSGTIWLEPVPGPGSKFVFTAFFPPAMEADVQARKSAATTVKAVHALKAGSRILLVEDNAENMILLRAYLENLPLSLDFASNGFEALVKRREGNYDLVLMDIQMPVMDGYTATREIRAWEKLKALPRVPIVALTAHALSGASAESMQAGCDGHLTKPVERGDLVEAIAKFANAPVQAPRSIPSAIEALRPAFLANRTLDLVKMRTALAVHDFASIQAIGHNCKGTGSGYGYPDISTIGSSIEQAAKDLSEDELEQALGRFEKCLVVG